MVHYCLCMFQATHQLGGEGENRSYLIWRISALNLRLRSSFLIGMAFKKTFWFLLHKMGQIEIYIAEISKHISVAHTVI